MDDEALYNGLLDVLYATFGQHRGFRVTHAKGLVAHGSFFASDEASELSRAAHFQGRPVPVVLRFSNFSGIPSTPDGDPMAGPRGLGMRFMLRDGVFTDIVTHSFDGFPVGTPEEFLAFLRGIAASAATPPDPRPLADFLALHPRARSYLETPKPTPASYLAERYYGVNTFRFIDRRGYILHGRYRIDPTIVEPPLDDRVAFERPPDFLARELTVRVQRGPALMRLLLQLPEADDALGDGSIPWPRSGLRARQEIALGIIVVESTDSMTDPQADDRELVFNPANLIDGIAASDDPMIAARDRVYRLAVERRRTQP